MKKIICSLLFFSSFVVTAQEKTTTYDAQLAKETGADEYGMKHYVFCLLKTGNNSTATSEEKQNYFKGHMDNIKKLANEGKLIIAGPFMKNDRAYRGIFILNCATLEEAQKMVATDPAVAAKIFEVELTPWYGSAALLLLKGYHEKVAKKSF